tara:strand:+ start:4226 stop:5302 length:1077 start_codon:yes stop_codon:yes gene_type:complete
MLRFRKYFNKKKIIITGHTGFKGSWLTLWLNKLGAKILGISLETPTSPSHFKILNLNKKIISKKIDIRNLNKLKKAIKDFKPDYVFHLAAQSLVHKSYKSPIKTWSTNTIGTINILESLRELNKKCTAIIITSDKVYKNLEIKRGYKENDLLGGVDPYSASKASAEIAIHSYIKSYFSKNSNVRVGIARAGNVIGGGDWSYDRLIPDCVKSWSRGKIVSIRNPKSTRPWQHVLEALSGYLIFAVNLKLNSKLHGEAFNFGPNQKNNYNVLNLLKESKKNWIKANWKIRKSLSSKNFSESKLLSLNSNKSKKFLNWKSVLNFSQTLKLVIDWYKKFYSSNQKKILSSSQIDYYEKIINS